MASGDGLFVVCCIIGRPASGYAWAQSSPWGAVRMLLESCRTPPSRPFVPFQEWHALNCKEVSSYLSSFFITSSHWASTRPSSTPTALGLGQPLLLPRLACHPPPSWSSAKAGMSSSTIMELCQGWHVILHHHGAWPRLACHPPPSWSSAKAGMSSSTIMELCQGWHVILHHHGARPRLACHPPPSWSSAKAGAVLPFTATSAIIRPTPPLLLRWQRLTN